MLSTTSLDHIKANHGVQYDDTIDRRLLMIAAYSHHTRQKITEALANKWVLLPDHPHPLTPKEKSLAFTSRYVWYIEQGHALFADHGQKVKDIIIAYLHWFSVQWISFSPSKIGQIQGLLDDIVFIPAYTEETRELWREPWSLGHIEHTLGQLKTVSLTLSMRHTSDASYLRTVDLFNHPRITSEWIYLSNFLSTLLHELLHVASRDVYLLPEGWVISKVGIEFFARGTWWIWSNMTEENEAITELLAEEIYNSESFQKAFPVLSGTKYKSSYVDEIAMINSCINDIAEEFGYTKHEIWTYIVYGYFWTIPDADDTRVDIFWAPSVIKKFSK